MATAFSRIVNQLGYKRQFVNPGCVRVVVPGLPYTAFDAHEQPQPWSVVNILDSVQICAVHKSPHDNERSLLDLHDIFGKHDVMIAASKITFSNEIYNKSSVKSPLLVENCVSNVGKTTLVIDTELTSMTDHTPLAKLRQLQIFLDKQARKTAPIPDWWREKFGKMIGSSEPMRFTALERQPTTEVSHASIGKVRYSDTDAFSHLNFSNYLKYCINGIFQDEYLQSEHKVSPKPLLMKSAFTWHRQECNLGDDLDIEYWKDDNERDTYCVDMMRGRSSVFQCRLEFFQIKSSL